jgi:hypothetical protein
MIVMTQRKKDAQIVQACLKIGVVAVYPGSPLTARMFRELLFLNQAIIKLADAALWKKIKYDDYDRLVSELDTAFARIVAISREMRKLLKDITPKKNTPADVRNVSEVKEETV